MRPPAPMQPPPLRHEVARVLAALRLLSAGMILAGLALTAIGLAAAGAVIALLPAALMTLVLLVEAAWSRSAGRRDPQPPPAVHLQALALIGELRAAAPRFLIDQPASRSPLRHLEERHRGQVAWILVHGYLCNAGFWRQWMERARREDRPALAVTLEPAFGSIDAACEGLDQAIREVTAATGCAVVVVAHSMGGLLVRAWWRTHPATADRWVAQVVTIGTPHLGTELARWAYTVNARQMAPDNEWLQALAAEEPPDRPNRFHCVHGHADHVVFPPRRAVLPGAASTHVENTAHVALADHPATAAVVRAATRRAETQADAPLAAPQAVV